MFCMYNVTKAQGLVGESSMAFDSAGIELKMSLFCMIWSWAAVSSEKHSDT